MDFFDGVVPSLDAAAHTDGGLFHFNLKANFPKESANELFERLVFAVLGNMSTYSGSITGVRLADKRGATLGMHNQAQPGHAIRFEVWHKKLRTEDLLSMRQEFSGLMMQELLAEVMLLQEMAKLPT